jgi:hypothetical protein
MEIDEKALSKIQGALALARDKSGNDDAESQTAMLLAQRLMAKHNLSMSDVEFTNSGGRERTVEHEGTEYIKMAWWMKELASIIASNFRCYSYLNRNRSKQSSMVFLGMDDDTKIAKEVYLFAIEMIKFYSHLYSLQHIKKGDKARTIAIKNDYISGYLSGLRDKFQEQVKENDWGLMLLKDDAVVEVHKNMNFRRGRASNKSSYGDNEARMSGYNDGRNFQQAKNLIDG